MRRKGIDVVPTLWTLSFAMVMIPIGAIYGGAVGNELKVSGGAFYGQAGMGEAVLNAPCATKSRAVFYNASVVSGDFECIHPKEVAYLSFESPEMTNYGWAVIQQSDRVKVAHLIQPARQNLAKSFDILIYDASTDTYTSATLWVGAK